MRPVLPGRPLFALLLAAAAVAAGSAPALAVDYHWIAVGPGQMGTAANWSPPRTSPAATDRLLFDSGTAVTMTRPIVVNIGQLVVTNGTQLTIDAVWDGFVTYVINVLGGTGTDLVVNAGSTLRITGAQTMRIWLPTGATAAIAGRLLVEPTEGFGVQHMVVAAQAEAIQFLNGSIAEVRGVQSTSPFFYEFNPSVPNMCRFQAGSTYIHGAGAPPPIADVVFDHGSRFKHETAVAPALIGRTFGDFEYNSSATLTSVGTGDFTMDSLVVKQGRFGINTTGVGHVKGSVMIRPGAFLELGQTGGATTIRLDGTAMQTVQNTTINSVPGLVASTGLRLVIANPSGVTLDLTGDLQLPGVLEFQSGVVSPINPEEVWPVRLVDGTTEGGSASSWLNGAISANARPLTATRTFPLGTATEYTPVTVAVHGLTGLSIVACMNQSAFDFGGSFFTGSQLDPVNRMPGGPFYVAVFPFSNPNVTFDATFHYAPPGGTTPLSWVAREYGSIPQVWRPTTTGTQTATSIQVLGVPSPNSDVYHYFAFGVPSTVTVSALDAEVDEGAPALKTGSNQGASSVSFPVVLSEPAVAPITVDYAVSAGSAEEGTDFEPTSGTLTFDPGDTVQVVNVPILGDATPELHETLSLTLTGATNAVIADPEATGTIDDDDDVTAPVATVLSPNGGETVLEGSTVDLTWSATDDVVVQSVDLLLSTDGGGTWNPIATGLENTGSHSWQAPVGLTQQALLRVVASDQHAHIGEDVSDAVWRIWGVDGVEDGVPRRFAFDIASANPTAGAMRFRLALTRDQSVRMLVHDVRGRLVGTPLEEHRTAGSHLLEWSGRCAGAGVYFVTVAAEEGSAVRRIVRLP